MVLHDPWLTRFFDCLDILGQDLCDSQTPTAATGTVQYSDHLKCISQIFWDEPVLEKSRYAECIQNISR